MPTIRTVTETFRWEIDKIKGSRFIASVVPVGDLGAVEAALGGLREEFRDATHNCFAWRLGSSDAMRFSDDGEPSGTAGRPILQEIVGRGLVDVLVVVTRYYGGTKLGTGGLIRAYGGAAAAALERVNIVERPVTDTLRVRFGYASTGAVQSVLAAHALEPSAASYEADVRLQLTIPVEDVDAVRRALVDATQGSARFEPEG